MFTPENTMVMDYVDGLFARTHVEHPTIEFDDRKPLICAVSIKRRVTRDIQTSTEVFSNSAS